MLAFSGLLYLRLREQVGRLLSAGGKRRLRQEITQAAVRERLPAVINLSPLVIRLPPEFQDLTEEMKEVERVWTFVTVSTGVRASEPSEGGRLV